MLLKMLFKRLMDEAGADGGAGAAAAPAAAAESSASIAAAELGAAAAGGAEGAAAGEGSASIASADAGEAGKPGEAKPGEEGKPAEETPPNYDELKFPEGMQADDELMGQFKTLAAETKVSPETAQKFIDMHAAALQKAANAPYDLWKTTQREWQDTIKADKEMGGQNLAKTQSTIAKLINSLGADAAKEFRSALDFTGAGNNPAIVRALFRIGSMHTEGAAVPGGKPAEVKQESLAKTIYPSLN